MSTAEIPRLARNPFEQLFDALVDPAHIERTMALLLTGYLATCSLYAVFAKISQDLHFDKGEMCGRSCEIGLGTPKPPALGAWLVHVWFRVVRYEILIIRPQ